MRQAAVGQRLAILCCSTFLGAAVSASAGAADIPGSAATKAVVKLGTKYTMGVLEKARDSDWLRIKLAKGVNYAFQLDFAVPFPIDGSGEDCGRTMTLVLADAQGQVAGKSKATSCYQDAGFELRPKRAGTYFLKVSGNARAGYKLRAATDAAPNVATDARLQPGEPIKAALLFGTDVDFYRTRPIGGRTYTLTLTRTGRCDAPYAQVVSGTGKVISGEGSFVPSLTGNYFVRVADYDTEFECSYSLLVG